MFKVIPAVFFSTLTLSTCLFASQEICPELSNIKAEGVHFPILDASGYGFYGAYNVSNYNTKSRWIFSMFYFAVDSKEKAIEAANNLLRTMSAPGIIDKNNNRCATSCIYDTGVQGIYAQACVKSTQ